MYEFVEQKKAELNEKAAHHKKELLQGYSDIIDNPGSFLRLGLLSGGLILNSIFPAIKDGKDDQTSTDTMNSENQLHKIENRGLEWQIKAEYKEKLILILLEILRQILLMITEKLTPAHDNSDLR